MQYVCIQKMKRWLKYILFSIIALAFYNSASGLPFDKDSEYEVQNINYILSEYIVHNTSISSQDTDFCPPRPVSTFSAPRLQSNGRRHDNSARQNFEFVKSGKTINSGIAYIVQEQSIFSHSTLIETSRRLVCLCRLII